MNKNKGLQNGRRAFPPKGTPSLELREDDLFGNMLRLDPELEKEIKASGLEARFVDAKRLFENGGYHPKGWQVYKRQSVSGTIGSNEFKFGNDPEGIVRRGSLILAVKTKDAAQQHRDFLRRKAALQATVVPKAAEMLRQAARESNVDTTVAEGYDDDRE